MADDQATEFLAATHRALCQHGYADLTLEDIATEATRSKASIHYHYDSKEHLFLEFLDYLYERYTAQLPSVDDGTPREQLYVLFETVFTDEDPSPDQEFRTALLEVTAQAPYNAAIRTRLSDFDEALFERVRNIIAAGVETGAFDPTVEPDVAAEFIVTLIAGSHTRRVTVDRPSEQLYETITWYANTHLLADELSGATH